MKSIIFMGTPDFAVPTLQALLDQKYDIKLVVTQPDRPSGRGQHLKAPPVKDLALKHGLKVYQPQNLKSSEAQKQILETECDFIVVIAFGQILPKAILEHPKFAPLNIHASLLPAYRGAAPIQRSILEGEEKTGVTVQWMIEALDQGDILFQLPCEITEEDSSESLHNNLKILGAQSILETLRLFEKDSIVRRSQDARVGSYAPKLTKKESNLSFDESAFFVHRRIMGLNPWPVAECQLRGENLRIFKSRFLPRAAQAEPGTVIETTSDEIVVSCQQGCVGILEVQLENRKRMKAGDFVRGHPVPPGLILGSKT